MNPDSTGSTGRPEERARVQHRIIKPARGESRRERQQRMVPCPDGRERNAGVSLLCFAFTLCLAAGAQGAADSRLAGSDVAAGDISKIVIRASHMGWGSVKTNLTLVRSNSLFVAGEHSVPSAAVSNLLAAMREPARAEIDPTDLGITPAWLATNQARLLAAFGGATKGAIFPNASPRQRAWLTNAVLDLDILADLVRSSTRRFWTDDYPEMEIGFSRGDTEIARLHSRAQSSFMLPWEVTWGTSKHTTFAAGISRGVVALLPEGFLNRQRIQGDRLSIIGQGFAEHSKVQAQIKRMTLEETLGAQTNRLFREFKFMRYSMPAGNYGGFPDTWMATLHRTNWPESLVMPVRTHVENGIVRLLPRLLDDADARVQPILKSPWLVKLLHSDEIAGIEVAPEGSMADDRYLRGHMVKVGLGDFYDQIRPLMEQGLAFTMRERNGARSRTSEWLVLPDGKLVLVKFAGNGALGWTPEELGCGGRQAKLDGFSYNMTGVFLTADGRIDKVMPQTSQ